MKNQVNLLKTDLLKDNKKLKTISFWCFAMNRPLGWHYDLDFIWILNELEQNDIKRGSKIMDAGAGLGSFQYMLAAEGYEVTSLDFSYREVPPSANKIFEITTDQEDFQYDHTYQDFIKLSNTGNYLKRLKENLNNGIINTFKRFYFKSLSTFMFLVTNTYLKFSSSSKDFGSIIFKRAAFHDIPFADNTFDAIISVSAIEHSDINLLGKNIEELIRVLKVDSPLLLTTSSSVSDQETYDDETEGWCFANESFSVISKSSINFIQKELDEAHHDILNSKIWRARLDPHYSLNPASPFYNKKTKSLPYLPVGIKVLKQKM